MNFYLYNVRQVPHQMYDSFPTKCTTGTPTPNVRQVPHQVYDRYPLPKVRQVPTKCYTDFLTKPLTAQKRLAGIRATYDWELQILLRTRLIVRNI